MDPVVPTGKGLTLDENRRLRALLKQLIDERYKNQTALAEALRIKQSTVSAFMSRERQGSSFQVAKRACALAGVPLSAIIEGLETEPVGPTTAGGAKLDAVRKLARMDRVPQAVIDDWDDEAEATADEDTPALELASDLFFRWRAHSRKKATPATARKRQPGGKKST